MLVRRWRGQGQGGWGWGRWARRVPVLSERLLGPGDAVCAWSTRWAAPLTSPLQCSVSGLCDVPLSILALRREQGLVLPRLHALTDGPRDGPSGVVAQGTGAGLVLLGRRLRGGQ